MAKDFNKMTPFQLGESESLEALPKLRLFLEEGNDLAKQSAAKASLKLFRTFEEESLLELLPALINNLKDEKSIVRQATLKTLIHFPLNEEHVESFEDILKNDSSSFNQKQAAKILTQITGTSVTVTPKEIKKSFKSEEQEWDRDSEWHLFLGYNQGFSITKLSRLYDRSEKSILKHLKKLGLVDSLGKKVYPAPQFRSTIREKVKAPSTHKNFRRKDAIKLTEQQNEALKEIQDFLKSDKNFYLLKGYAGTGKSTLCCHTIKQEQDIKFALTAPTNKAMRVLNTMRLQENLKVYCTTIHSLLNLIPKEREGKIILEEKEPPNLNRWSAIIIDECSMINAELMQAILAIPDNYPKMKVIFMGDGAQLPPIGEEISPALLIPKSSELSEIVRQKQDNPILSLSAEIRQNIQEEKEQLPFIQAQSNADTGIFKAKNETTWLKWMQVYFCKDEFKKNNDTFRVVTWSNARVRQINDMIRLAIYGETRAPFTVGEKVLVTAPVLLKTRNRRDEVKVLIKTDEECDVLEIYETDIKGIPSWILTIQNDEGEKADVTIADPKAHDLWQATEQDLKKTALENRKKWGAYYDFVNSFDSVQAPYCMTVHRSQGSTFKHVFVDLPEINRNPNRLEAAKMLYVAITRCTHSILIY